MAGQGFRRLVPVSALIFVTVAAGAGLTVVVPSAGPRRPVGAYETGARAKASMARLPLYFVENRGQVLSGIDYYLQGRDTSVGASSDGILFSFRDPAGSQANLRLEFVGASPVNPVARGRTGAVVSYFTGSRDQWLTGLPTYSRVSYEDVWPGVDLTFSGNGSRLKSTLRLDPWVDPTTVGLAWRGAERLEVNSRGQLQVHGPAKTLTEGAPRTYQVVQGRRVPVPSAYRVGSGASYGFWVAPYDRSRPLVIDPAMFVYAGFMGGTNGDQGRGVAVDLSGAAYVTGWTASTETTFPDGDGVGTLPGYDQIYNGGTADAFVAKVNPAGTTLVYITYLGGSDRDEGHAIAVDTDGATYVTGSTLSSNFPTGGAADIFYGGGGDGFVAKVGADGTTLGYSGYVGGNMMDSGEAIAVRMGEAYVAGITSSAEATFFPSGGPDSFYNGGGDAFVEKLTVAGSYLRLGYIGGTGTDLGSGIAVDGSGNAYVAGDTASDEATFPDGDGAPTGPDVTYNGMGDAFVAKVNYPPLPTPATIAYAGYVGGSNSDSGRAIGVDSTGAAYLGGNTVSSESTFPDGNGFGPLPGADTTYNGNEDAFVAKVAPSGSSLGYAGYVGGSLQDRMFDIAVDASGGAYVTGFTQSGADTFPDGDGFGSLTGPDVTFNGGEIDAFIVSVGVAGSSLVYGGYVGGSMNDFGRGIAVDATGGAYITGHTSSTETTFPDGDGLAPLPGPDGSYNGGTDDAFVVKILGPPPTETPPAACKGNPATVVGTAANDNLAGTAGRDVIAAQGGKDTIKSLGGNDLVCAGDGNDTVNGGGGKDRILGEKGKDRLKGARGNDRLNGGPKRDVCVGGPGRNDKSRKCELVKSVP